MCRPDFVTAQIDAVFSDLDVGAVKIGMLSQPAVIKAVASGLARYKQSKIVLDPVMIATSGDRLLAPEAIEVLRDVLMTQALIITPNLPEAAALLETTIAENEAEMQAQGEKLLALGARAVLIKGGHGSGAESVDILIEPAATARLAAERIDTRTHTAPAAHCRRPLPPVSPRGSTLPTASGRPRPMSPPRSRRRTSSRSVMATGRCIIFIIGGMGTDMSKHFHAVRSLAAQRWVPRRAGRAARSRAPRCAGAW